MKRGLKLSLVLGLVLSVSSLNVLAEDAAAPASCNSAAQDMVAAQEDCASKITCAEDQMLVCTGDAGQFVCACQAPEAEKPAAPSSTVN